MSTKCIDHYGGKGAYKNLKRQDKTDRPRLGRTSSGSDLPVRQRHRYRHRIHHRR